jgi:hypothetical protein
MTVAMISPAGSFQTTVRIASRSKFHPIVAGAAQESRASISALLLSCDTHPLSPRPELDKYNAASAENNIDIATNIDK